MGFFVRLGQMQPCEPDCEAAQAWAKELQDFFTAHYYTRTQAAWQKATPTAAA